jgi:hypothetical protein
MYMQRVSQHIAAVEKLKNITYSERAFVVLAIICSAYFNFRYICHSKLRLFLNSTGLLVFVLNTQCVYYYAETQ